MMGTWSITSFSSIMVSGRIDGEYYLPAYLENDAVISKIETKPLPQLFHVSDGNHLSVSRYFVDSGGIPYYRGQDINDFFIDNASPVKILESIYYSGLMRRSHFFGGDILLSIVGTIGSLSFVPPSLGRATGSCKIAILREKTDCSGAFLSAFLLGKYGQLQIHRNTRGAVQMGLILKDLERIRIPIISDDAQSEVSRLIEKAIASNSASRSEFGQAKNLLESELGLDKLTFQKPVGYTARFSDLETSRRFDPEHYYPAFEAFANSLPRGIALSPLRKYLTFCQRGKQPIYSSAGLRVINSKHVQPNHVLIEGNRFAAANPDDNLQIRDGDTLLNGTGRGTLGRAAPYLIDEPAVPDNHVTILRSDDLDPVYLSLYLNSAAGQMQVEMFQRGTSGQLELYPFDIRKFLIWPAPESLQQELRRLHDQAAAAERESKQLFEQAKSHVEQLIEEAART